jgi:integrase
VKRTWISNGTVLIRLGPNHFAFMRGYLEGLSLERLAKRYLESSGDNDPDLRLARANLRWIREQLMIAARRSGAFSMARVLFIDPDRLTQSPQQELPTLEEFREIRDPHEMFTESELIELFHEEYGGHAQVDRRIARNDRLRRRQMDALASLERLLGEPPAMSDDVAGWLDPILARRLKAVQLHTIGDIVDLVNTRGFRWWTQVPRFGAKAAAQVVAWLKTDSISLALGSQGLGLQATTKSSRLKGSALLAARPREFGLVPLEYLELPAYLDGSRRGNRGTSADSRLMDDLQAIHAWLEQNKTGSSTWRSYRREAERFLIWMLMERGKSFSEVSREDALLYTTFLAQLGHAVGGEGNWPYAIREEEWLAPRATRRWSRAWRPFEGPLSLESRQQAGVILNLLGKYLVSCGYWKMNPLSEATAEGSKVISRRNSNPRRETFSPAQLTAIRLYVESQLTGEERARMRWLIYLCHLGVRASEIIACRVGDIEFVDKQDRGMLAIPAGARAGRRYPVCIQGMQLLHDYLTARRLTRGISTLDVAPLVVAIRSEVAGGPGSVDRTISVAGIAHVLKHLFLSVSMWTDWDKHLEIGGSEDRKTWTEELARLQIANLHWFARYREIAGEAKGERFWDHAKD